MAAVALSHGGEHVVTAFGLSAAVIHSGEINSGSLQTSTERGAVIATRS